MTLPRIDLQRREVLALVWVTFGVAWFGSVGPEAVEQLREQRIAQTRTRALVELRGMADARPDRVTTVVRRQIEEASGLVAAEEAWSRTVAGVLTDAERRDGLAAIDTVPPAPDLGPKGPVEPDIDALARDLLDRHGYAVATPPTPAEQDPWGGVTRRDRARAARAVVRAGSLDDARAHALLAATLHVLDVQKRRVALEKAIQTALDDGEAAPR